MENEVTFDKFGTSSYNCGTFHSKRGLNVELSEGNTVALVGGVHHFNPSHVDGPPAVIDMRRIVFSSKPIGVTGTFQVNVTRRKFTSRSGRFFTFDGKSKRGDYYEAHQTMVSILSSTDKNSRNIIIYTHSRVKIGNSCL